MSLTIFASISSSEQYPERFVAWLSEQPSVEVDVPKTELSVEPMDFVAFYAPKNGFCI